MKTSVCTSAAAANDAEGCHLHHADGCLNHGAAAWKGTDLGEGLHHLHIRRLELPSGIGGLRGVLERQHPGTVLG